MLGHTNAIDKITESNSRVPPVGVVCSSTIKHKPVFLDQWNEIGDNRFSSLIHFTHQQPPENQRQKQKWFLYSQY